MLDPSKKDREARNRLRRLFSDHREGHSDKTAKKAYWVLRQNTCQKSTLGIYTRLL